MGGGIKNVTWVLKVLLQVITYFNWAVAVVLIVTFTGCAYSTYICFLYALCFFNLLIVLEYSEIF